MRAFMRLTGAPTNMSSEDACERLNRLPWGISEENLRVWQRVLWNGGVKGKIITKNRNLATKMIAYLAGERVDVGSPDGLLKDYQMQFPENERKGLELPTPSRSTLTGS